MGPAEDVLGAMLWTSALGDRYHSAAAAVYCQKLLSRRAGFNEHKRDAKYCAVLCNV
jgi:hypothetical protein